MIRINQKQLEIKKNSFKLFQRISFFILFFTIRIVSLTAQVIEEDSIVSRNITIEREYQPVIKDAGKINSLPYFIEPKISKINPQYTTGFSKPLNVEQNIHYLAPAGLAQPQTKSHEGFARLGVGTGFNSLADFAFPLVKKSDMKLDFILNHYGLFNDKAYSATQAALAFDKQFGSIIFYAGIGGRHDYYKYYGNNFNSVNSIIDFNEMQNNFGTYTFLPARGVPEETDLISLAARENKNNMWRLNLNTGINTSPATADLRYGIHLDYNLFNTRTGITEHQIALAANFDAEVAGNRLGIEISSQNQFYSTSDNTLSDALKNYYVLTVNPYYSIEQEAFDLKLGVKSSFSFAHGRGFSPSPDIKFEWRAVPSFLAVYAGATGNYRINTLNNMYLENYYLNPDVLVDDTYIPVNFYLGVKIKPAAGLMLDAYLDYKYINDQYFFVNKEYKLTERYPSNTFPVADTLLYTNRFEAIYSNANQLTAGARISYDYQSRLNVQLSGAYNYRNVKDYEYAWHKPAWEVNFNAGFKPVQKLNIYADMHLAGKRYSLIGGNAVEMKTKVDINLGASYEILDWISAFVKVNNLINNKYEQWYGYEVQGFNVMAGAVFNF